MYCILKNVDAIYIFSLFQKVILFQFHFESEDTFSPHVSLATLCEFKNTEKYGNIKNMKRIRKGASGYFSRSKSDQEYASATYCMYPCAAYGLYANER